MPGMSGPELRDTLRGMGRDSPLVFITAHGTDEIEEDLRLETVLPKPLEADVLVRAIDAAISGVAPLPRKRVRMPRRSSSSR